MKEHTAEAMLSLLLGSYVPVHAALTLFVLKVGGKLRMVIIHCA